MPLLNIYSSAVPPNPERADALLLGLSKIVARLIGKPERYVMTCLVPQTRMTFGGTTEPSCYMELKSIGRMTPALTAQLSLELSRAVETELGVPKSRTYVEFSEAEGYLWGFDGSTFG